MSPNVSVALSIGEVIFLTGTPRVEENVDGLVVGVAKWLFLLVHFEDRIETELPFSHL